MTEQAKTPHETTAPNEPSQAYGTMECPICGFDKPHTHEQSVVEWHRTGRGPEAFQDGPINDNQREQMRAIAESQHRIRSERAAFNANPRGFLQSGMNLHEQGGWVDALLGKLETAEARAADLSARLRAREEEIANISDAIAEHCARHGDAGYHGKPLDACVRQLAADFQQSRAETIAADALSERKIEELEQVWVQRREFKQRAEAAEARADAAEREAAMMPRIRAQAMAISELLRGANVGSCTLEEGVRILIQRADAAEQQIVTAKDNAECWERDAKRMKHEAFEARQREGKEFLRAEAAKQQIERAFKAGYHCRWLKDFKAYSFDPVMSPGDPDGAWAAWLKADPAVPALPPQEDRPIV